MLYNHIAHNYIHVWHELYAYDSWHNLCLLHHDHIGYNYIFFHHEQMYESSVNFSSIAPWLHWLQLYFPDLTFMNVSVNLMCSLSRVEPHSRAGRIDSDLDTWSNREVPVIASSCLQTPAIRQNGGRKRKNTEWNLTRYIENLVSLWIHHFLSLFSETDDCMNPPAPRRRRNWNISR